MNKKSKIDKEKFPIRLKELMKERKETIYSLAEITHLTPATISRYTTKHMIPKVTTVEILAQHFKVNPAWLMGEDVDKTIENRIEAMSAAMAANAVKEHVESMTQKMDNLSKIILDAHSYGFLREKIENVKEKLELYAHNFQETDSDETAVFIQKIVLELSDILTELKNK